MNYLLKIKSTAICACGLVVAKVGMSTSPCCIGNGNSVQPKIIPSTSLALSNSIRLLDLFYFFREYFLVKDLGMKTA